MIKLVAAAFSFVILVLAGLVQSQCSAQAFKGQYILTRCGYIEPGDPGVQA
jgi:hypothetical protein